MKTSIFSEEQIALALKQAETETPVKKVVRKMGISEQPFYRLKQKFGAACLYYCIAFSSAS